MHRSTCNQCGGTFWETYKGARGEDICDRCETLRRAKADFAVGMAVRVGDRAATVRAIDGHGLHLEFCDCPEIGTWAHDPDSVTPAP